MTPLDGRWICSLGVLWVARRRDLSIRRIEEAETARPRDNSEFAAVKGVMMESTEADEVVA
jgi:hypothetical protein